MNFPIAEMRRFENFEIGIIEIVTSILPSPVSDYYVQRIRDGDNRSNSADHV